MFGADVVMRPVDRPLDLTECGAGKTTVLPRIVVGPRSACVPDGTGLLVRARSWPSTTCAEHCCSEAWHAGEGTGVGA